MDTLAKVGAGVAVAGVLATGGSVAVDQSINPYNAVSVIGEGKEVQALEIAAPSTVEDAGVNKIDAQTDKPRIEMQKWGGEVKLGVTYTGIPDDTTGSRPFLSKNVEWQGKTQHMEMVPLEATTTMEDGGMEINIHLDEKPASNVFTFQLDNWENLDFFYQPALTPQEIAEGDQRPENVVGSYAVYYKNHANHKVGSTNYATGKAYHIFRPKVTDADGKTVWGELGYADGVLSLTVPQSFLDSAAYPVVVDPTFGYTTVGGTAVAEVGGTNRNTATLVNTYTASTGDTVTVLNTYAQCTVSGSGAIDHAIYSTSGIVVGSQTAAPSTITVNSTTAQWYTSSVSIALSGGTTYTIAVGNWVKGTCTALNVFRDVTSGNQNSQDDGLHQTLPDPWQNNANSASQFSLYATYTVASPNPAQVVVTGGTTAVNGAATRQCAFGVNCASAATAISQIAATGSIDKLRFHWGNAVTGANTIAATLLLNGGATPITCTLTGGATDCSDLTHSVSVKPGDTLAWQTVGSGGPTAIPSIVANFTPTTAGDTVLFAQGISWNAASETMTSISEGTAAGTIANRQTTFIPESGTLDKLYATSTVAPGAAASGKTFTFAGNLNTADQTLTCLESETATACNDTTHSFAVVDGDKVGFTNTPAGTPTVTGVTGLGFRYVSGTSGNFLLLSPALANADSASLNTYFTPGGQSLGSTTESGASATMNAMTMTKMEINIGTAPGGVGKTRDFYIRINSATSSATCSITNTGKTCTWTGTLAIAAGDSVSVVDAPTSAPGASTVAVSIVANNNVAAATTARESYFFQF